MELPVLEPGSLVHLSSELRARGFEPGEVLRLARSGALTRIRRGAYASGQSLTSSDGHRLLIAATLPQLSPAACLSHTSAAFIHGLPSWDDTSATVHVTKSRVSGGRCDPGVHVHPAVLGEGDVVERDGVAVTSLARTVADCARTLPFRRGVALGDAALRAGLDPAGLAEQLERARRRRGIRVARRVACFIDGRSESVGESYSRVTLDEIGLPPSGLQVVVIDEHGRQVARCDFGWEEVGAVGEFDGKIKYGRLLRPGESAGDAVFREKVREDRVRDQGLEVVRWVTDDLRRPDLLRSRLLRAFARGRTRTR